MRPTPYVASLRIYEPLSSFPAADQLRWSSIPIQSYTGRDEELRALTRTIILEPPSLKADGAHIIDHGDKRYVSPWSTARRCWAALEEFRNSLPSSVIPLFLSDEFAEKLNKDGALVDQRIPHIISETWIIPPRWFALFTPEERLRGENSDGIFTLMRTDISSAKKRCQQAHQIVHKAFGSGPVEDDLAQLLNWLSVFHPESILECDYGGLAGYMEKSLQDQGFDGLEADTSIEDLLLSLQGLDLGDGALAGKGYEALTKRWRRVASFEQAM